jgi:hypothetical protein
MRPKARHDFKILSQIMVGIASPSFSAPVISFYEARFGLYRNLGNRQERMTLSSVRDKRLM